MKVAAQLMPSACRAISRRLFACRYVPRKLPRDKKRRRFIGLRQRACRRGLAGRSGEHATQAPSTRLVDSPATGTTSRYTRRYRASADERSACFSLKSHDYAMPLATISKMPHFASTRRATIDGAISPALMAPIVLPAPRRRISRAPQSVTTRKEAALAAMG